MLILSGINYFWYEPSLLFFTAVWIIKNLWTPLFWRPLLLPGAVLFCNEPEPNTISALCVPNTAFCRLCSAHCVYTLCFIHCVPHNIFRALYSPHCVPHAVFYTLCFMHCAPHDIYRALYSPCNLCSAGSVHVPQHFAPVYCIDRCWMFYKWFTVHYGCST